ncbi:FAD-binding oxidoreductase [Sulfitobacter sp. M57]|uniref:NAD(P)/FAD-dependent oxidoreductase n=1 Tax=unclassified Sulfitobacter TaxID=196795 RepID=UPI0023E1AF2C|nr:MULTISPECIES: FAD-binding oxidoreductase [unclassified Sulfitobacter]MDF3412931.1 FAD-binding oxidoreductase [Sulfitobacter sp. KE5]MDF3421785.1 FAD-binding oxidoreductase [Sulfitobacter sp. KE43]MDF3431480.1 FAD-binding oxidoreductase [Sulfitobacter sp. KE42]MDF3457121.1 FAD-binding oxidoreductase [Sulfitobacter sp. S74]MDF3461024.1 FAD-binding oxidoreductase [Sulfitobacter sp. Ks18]
MGNAAHKNYDVVIIGGAIYGSSVAWWLTQMQGFDGRILVVERDPTYEFASTSHTNSCIRQQFSNPLNIQISRFGAEFIKGFRGFIGDDPEVPELVLQSYGYLYLADTPAFAQTLRESQVIQATEGAHTRHMTRDEIAAEYPFYQLDDILAANHNLVDEGYFDGGTMFDWFKRMARRNGVEYIHDEVVDLSLNSAGTAVDGVTLKSGDVITCGTVVNASGPRAVATARMAGIDLPVQPRKRYTFIFDAATPLDRDLPLTIDPSGVHMRSEGKYYLAGCPPDEDPDVAFDDFGFDHNLWQEKVWPIIATRVPAFEQVKVINEWVGHYAYNTFDQNAVIGRHSKVANFIFANGFSGHGLQQSPALGRGIAEQIAFGEYRSLDLAPFGFARLENQQKFMEKAVI